MYCSSLILILEMRIPASLVRSSCMLHERIYQLLPSLGPAGHDKLESWDAAMENPDLSFPKSNKGSGVLCRNL
jgi:hypothetical protein